MGIRRVLSIAVLAALAAPAMVIAASGPAAAAIETYTTVLTGGQEVPPDTSTGAGTATVQLDTTTSEITVTGSFSGLGSNAAVAHIHGPGAPGVDAGILIDLTVPNATSGTIALAAPTTLTPTQVTQLQTGLLYVNVHSGNFPGGEIRGQLGVPSPTRGVGAATAGKSAQASVSFVVPIADGGAPITGYLATCTSAGQATRTAMKATSPIVVTGLANGKSYACIVQGKNARGNGARSRAANILVGSPSSPLAASAAKGAALGSIKVTWSGAVTFAGAPVTGFAVSCVSGASSKGVLANASARTATVGALNRALSYTCRVSARNMFGFGATRAAAPITPR